MNALPWGCKNVVSTEIISEKKRCDFDKLRQLLLLNKHSPFIRPEINHSLGEPHLIKAAYFLVYGLSIILFSRNYQGQSKIFRDSKYLAWNILFLHYPETYATVRITNSPVLKDSLPGFNESIIRIGFWEPTNLFYRWKNWGTQCLTEVQLENQKKQSCL